MARSKKNVPEGFSPEARKLWISMYKKYEIPEEVGQILLEACKTLSELHEVRAMIKKQGRTYTAKSGIKHINPLCRVAKDLQSSFLQAMRLLPLGKQ